MNAILQNTLLVCVMVGFALIEYISRRYQQSVHPTADDNRLEVFTFLGLIAVAQPIALLTTNAVCARWIPEHRGALAELPIWVMVALLLVADDLTQYLWHRASHSPWLWPLHRAHHTARYMSIRMAYRNNLIYYLMMPGLWISGLLVYLGFGLVYAVYVIVKLVVILGAHSAWRWDEPLYRIPALAPLMWVLERTISTPATHWAHHALTNADGVGHYKGNFGNLLFLWDMLFGTAHITRRYPARVGLQDDLTYGQERWYYQWLFPFLQSRREHSVLRFGARANAEAETRSDA